MPNIDLLQPTARILMNSAPRQSRPDTPIDSVLGRLEGVQDRGNSQYLARCPAHDDGRPSLSVREGREGQVLLHCFAACPAGDVLAAIGLTLADLYPDDPRSHGRPLSRFHRRPPPRDALAAIDHESLVVQVIAADIAAQRFINTATWQRLVQAGQRIASARALYA